MGAHTLEGPAIRPLYDSDGLAIGSFVQDDGGRAEAGFSGQTGDCVVRAIAIAAGLPYRRVYDDLNAASKAAGLHRATYRTIKRGRFKGRVVRRAASTSRTGTADKVWKHYLERLGWHWTPTMKIGSGCKVHLRADELPAGRLIVSVSRHLVAVIDGAIHDTHDCTRGGTRCVYGYYQPAET